MPELDPEAYEAAKAGDPEAQTMVQNSHQTVRGFDHISFDAEGGPFDPSELYFEETE